MANLYVQKLLAQELLSMVQEINSYNGGMDHLEIFDMDSFNDIMYGLDPISIAMRVSFGDFNGHHDYFKFNGHGNLESLSEHELENELLEWEEDIREVYNELFD